MMLSRCLWLLLLGGVLFWPAASLRAGSLIVYEGFIGYAKLKQELIAQGLPIPNGAGVKVSQIEAYSGDNLDFLPNMSHSQFGGKIFTQLSTGSAGPSSHATLVGRLFYGNTHSMAPGVTQINLYSASGWLANDYLKYQGSPATPPLSVAARVANHSWVGEHKSGENPDPAADRKTLRRVDYVIATDEYIQVVGLNNGSDRYNLLGSSMNAISVGRADGNHAFGTDPIEGSVYLGGLTRPDLVVPDDATSYTAPAVAAAAAMLIQVARDNPQLSQPSLVLTPANRNALTLRSAETSEVIRALLMAGADRYAITDYPNGYTYTPTTSNNLDQRFGAGMLNVYNSYKILTAGEVSSLQDGGGALVGPRGFDYDQQFGGSASTNTTASYTFIPTGNDIDFNASLVWNLKTDIMNNSETLHNLDLRLWDMSIPASPLLVQSSLSTNQNTEHIRELLYPGRAYKLEVTRGAGSNNFLWDYALAWRSDTFYQDGDFDRDGDVDIWDFMVIQGNFGSTSATPLMGDLDLDLDVDKRDYDLFRSNWGWRSDTHGISIPLSLGGLDLPGTAQPPIDPATVPEPAAALLLLALAALPARRRRASA